MGEERVSCKVNEGNLCIQTGTMARQANGAVVVRYGDTVVLVSAVSPREAKTDLDFFPLTVDYREKTSAAGKFPGGYIKREGRPTEKEILSARLTDRPIRPLFPRGYYQEVQIMSSVISADGENDPDVLSIIGASAALHVSDIPFFGPVGAVRVGLIDDKLCINPTHTQLQSSRLDMVMAGTEKAVLMVEGHGKEISEKQMLDAIMQGHEVIKDVVRAQNELRDRCGKPKGEVALRQVDEGLVANIDERIGAELDKAVRLKTKQERNQAVGDLFRTVIEELTPEYPDLEQLDFMNACGDLEKRKIRSMILKDGVRNDGRGVNDIRPISIELGLLPRTHGSALFTRGETQALAIATLGGEADEQRSDTLAGEHRKKFMLHYSFPPFSVGEAKPIRGPGRREIGHGALAERALMAVIPPYEEFPYTTRIVSDILESNGSSSMASVCGGSLAMMDAGVPVTSAVAGIAMGLIKEDGRVVILSDILGSEDAVGDMDFKIAGTGKGITAFQMDIKIEGITGDVIQAALEQAREGRLHILEKMNAVISHPRPNLSEYAPRIKTIKIEPDKIGMVIGPGGKMIRKIIEQTEAEIDIDDDGCIHIYSSSEESIMKAIDFITRLTADVEVGKIYKGTVKNIVDFGAFVEVLPGKEGLVHISKLADHRVKNISDIVKVGDQIPVKVMEIDEKGRINLSRRDALKEQV